MSGVKLGGWGSHLAAIAKTTNAAANNKRAEPNDFIKYSLLSLWA